MLQQNASKFAIILECENPRSFHGVHFVLPTSFFRKMKCVSLENFIKQRTLTFEIVLVIRRLAA